MPAPPPSPGPQSVDRALAVLDAVADADRPVGAKALARQLGCALSTVYHLTGPLLARGYLVRTSEGYAPGPAYRPCSGPTSGTTGSVPAPASSSACCAGRPARRRTTPPTATA